MVETTLHSVFQGLFSRISIVCFRTLERIRESLSAVGLLLVADRLLSGTPHLGMRV